MRRERSNGRASLTLENILRKTTKKKAHPITSSKMGMFSFTEVKRRRRLEARDGHGYG